jgi:inorganic pyrophosphatase
MSDPINAVGAPPPKTFTVDDFIDVRVISSGDDTAVYDFDPHAKGLRLKEIHRTSTVAPIDLAEVPDSSIDNADNVPVWLIVHRSIFPGAIVTARPIGLLTIQSGSIEQRSVIAVAAIDPHFDAIQVSSDLPADQRRALIEYACDDRSEAQIRWESATAAHEWIHRAKQLTRVARAGQDKQRSLPAWKPLGYLVAGARRSTETEPNSDAEYAYHQLPYRFQKYVDEYLAPDERILFAVNRPLMKSARSRTWLSRATLQEGILFVTDQQVSLVAEIVPPDSANIRYGYIAQTVPPERIHSLEVDVSRSDGGVLRLKVCAAGSQQIIEWEFPRAASAELNEAAKILAGWLPRPDDRRLRRAESIEPFKVRLRDPAANDPQAIAPVIERLEAAIAQAVKGDEKILAQALLPAWVERRDRAEAIVVTTRRFLRVPDPAARRSMQAIGLAQIASIEFSMSILESYLTLYHVHQGRVQTERILFPYTGVGFKECFTALRQQMARLVN